MKSQNRILTAGAALLCIGMMLQTACETKSTDELEVVISPKRATIMDGQTIALRASGWTNYRWTLQNPSWGVLSPTVGETVYYTATEAVNGVQVISVTGFGTSSAQASPTTGTNAPVVAALDLTGEAYITHEAPIPDEEDDDGDDGQTTTTTTTSTTTTTTGDGPPTP